MERYKYIIPVIVLVALISIFQGFANKDNSRFAKNSHDTTFDEPMNMKGSAFTINGRGERKSRPIAAPKWGSFQVAGFTAANNTNSDKYIAPKAASAATTKKDAKKVAKKKLKKGRGGATFTTNQTPNLEKQTEDKKKMSEPKGDFMGYVPSSPTTVIEEKKEKTAAELMTLEDWEDYLLNNPDYTKAIKLVEAYKSKELANPAWFYILTQKMIMSNSQDMKEVGFYTLGSIKSYQSFHLLSHTYNLFGPDLRDQNIQRLHVYSYDVNNWPTLKQVIANSDTTSKLVGIEVLKDAVNANVGAKSKSGNSRTGRGAAAEDSNNPYVQFISVLESLKNDKDPAVQQSAQDALDLIRNQAQ